ncbi:thioredoxin-disulfide reductase, partial [Burkholderia multivorans]
AAGSGCAAALDAENYLADLEASEQLEADGDHEAAVEVMNA